MSVPPNDTTRSDSSAPAATNAEKPSLDNVSAELQQPNKPVNNPSSSVAETATESSVDARPKEYGGREGLEPTRYGDWEVKGRCVDF